MKKYLFGIITGFVFAVIVGVSAAIIYSANEVSFNPTNSEWNVSTVEEAINDLENSYYSSSDVKKLISKVGAWTFSYTGNVQTFDVPISGTYKIELWGAQGGSGYLYTQPTPGKGAYTSGYIKLDSSTQLYLYVGGQGASSTSASSVPVAGWNGGGTGSKALDGDDSAGAGGGATDVRLVSGSWNDSSSLSSRIMVAGGGGGSHSYATSGTGSTDAMNAGALQVTGSISTWNSTFTPTVNQTSGYKFGIGMNGPSANHAGAGAGGGYYGGYTQVVSNASGRSSGGSSYISGYTGCVAITSESDTTPKSGCTDGTTDISCSYHYSGKVFENTLMYSGLQSMPTHDGSSTMVGNTGNGYAKITLVSVD